MLLFTRVQEEVSSLIGSQSVLMRAADMLADMLVMVKQGVKRQESQ